MGSESQMEERERSWSLPGEIFPRPIYFGSRVLLQARDTGDADVLKGLQALHVVLLDREDEYWSRVLPAAQDMRCFPTSPALILLVEGAIEALDWRDGSLVWDYGAPAGTSLYTPAIQGEYVVVGRSDSVIAVLDAHIGSEVWSWETPFHVGAPMIDLPWIVMRASRFLYAVCQGEEEVAWRYDPVGSILAAQIADGAVWVLYRPRVKRSGSSRRALALACLDLKSGEPRWEAKTVQVEGGRLHVHQGKPFLVAKGEIIRFCAETGRVLWRVEDAPVASESAVAWLPDGGMIAGRICLDPEKGDLRWTSPVASLAEPFVVGNVVLFVRVDRVLAVDVTTGATRGLFALPQQACPGLHFHRNEIFLGSGGGRFHAFSAQTLGHALEPRHDFPIIVCPRCRGRGVVSLMRPGRVSTKKDCPDCDTTGWARTNLPYLFPELAIIDAEATPRGAGKSGVRL